MTEEDELFELEQRMRAKLKPEAPRKGGLSADEMQIAKKIVSGPLKTNAYGLGEQEYMMARRLLGSANADRIAKAPQGRRVRIAPVVTTVEWYVVPGRGSPDIWHYDLKVNGRKEDHASGVDFDDLNRRLLDFGRRNIAVKRIWLEGQQKPAPKPTGTRKTFAERYGSKSR